MFTSRPTAPTPQAPHGSDAERFRLAEELLVRHGDRLRRIAAQNGPRDEDPEDAVQSALAQFLEHFTGPDELALPWLITTLKRLCWRQARTRRRRPQISFAELTGEGADGGDGAEHLPSSASDPADLVMRCDEISRQRRALRTLPHDQRLALIYSALELSHAEIAELTGWNRRQIRRYVQKGNAALAEVNLEGGAS